MEQLRFCSLTLLILTACAETKYIPGEAVGSERLPAFFAVSTSTSTEESLSCVLRELSLSNSNNTFEHKSANEGWDIDIIYGKNGVVGGGQIGKVKRDMNIITFFYRPAVGNFGLDGWNVERVVPNALKNCA